jgi:hypothetical protein
VELDFRQLGYDFVENLNLGFMLACCKNFISLDTVQFWFIADDMISSHSFANTVVGCTPL